MPGSASLMVGVILRSSNGVANWARASADIRLAAATITASRTCIVAITWCDFRFVKGDRPARAGLHRSPRRNCGARSLGARSAGQRAVGQGWRRPWTIAPERVQSLRPATHNKRAAHDRPLLLDHAERSQAHDFPGRD